MASGRGKDELFFNPDLIMEKPGWNGRNMESPETQAHIRRMADCIKENGTEAFPPITIYQENGVIYVSAGHCRRRAHSLAKAEGAPIKGICCRADTLSDEDRVLDQLNSNSGLDLNSLEKAIVIKRLCSFGWTVQEVAKKTGTSTTHIENQLALANAPMEIKNMVRDGEVAARTVVDVVRREGGEKATETLQQAVQNAKEQGKTKATSKHLPKEPQRQGNVMFSKDLLRPCYASDLEIKEAMENGKKMECKDGNSSITVYFWNEKMYVVDIQVVKER